MMRKYSMMLLAAFCMSVQAQVSHGGRPLPVLMTKSFHTQRFEEMPAFDLEEELRRDALEQNELRGGYRFAYKFITDFKRSNSGTSFTLADGTRVWMLGIRSPGALSINVLFTEFELPEGAQLFLYNASRTQVLGAFNHLNHSPAGLLPVSPIRGEEIIIEYQEPARAAFPGRLTVGEVNHGYRNLYGYEPGGDRSEYSCMPAPVCFDEDRDYAHISRSTVLLTIDGVTACTGVMVNNTANDGKPYLLTASHCLNKDFSVKNPDYEAVAGRIICFFNYASPTCDTLMRGTEEMSVASALYRAVNEKSDMALLELAEAPPVYYQPYYAGWTTEENGGAPPYAGIHHPTASVKRVNIYEKNLSLKTFDIREIEFYRNAHWNVDRWNQGSTAEGSSGSPLFEAGNRLVGLLSGGRSTCNLPVDDYYYAFFKAWNPSENVEEQLKSWLDPSGSDKQSLEGLDPYADNPCYRLSNIGGMRLQDSIQVTELPPPATGKLFGTNSLQTVEYAEEYRVNGNVRIEGVYLLTPSVTDAASSLDVEITVYKGDDKPQTLLHTEPFYPVYMELSVIDSSLITTGKRLNREQESFIRFDKAVIASGAFYIGYKIKSPAASSFAVYNLPKGLSARNTAWIKNKGEWLSASAHPLLPFSTSLFLDPVIRYTSDVSNDTILPDHPVKIWVDALQRRLHLSYPPTPGAAYRLYSTSGQIVQEESLSGSEAVISLSGIPSAVYIIQVRGNNLYHTQKVYL